MSKETINTAKATRRPLRFETIDDVRREIDHIIAAERVGTLRSTGNWTPGQAFGHLAARISYAWEGYPPELDLPLPLRFLMRMGGGWWLARHLAKRSFTPGESIPNVAAGTTATEQLSTSEGAGRLHEALNRLEAGEPAMHHSPLFGKMSERTRIALQLRHAELHLSFFWTDRDPPSSNVRGTK